MAENTSQLPGLQYKSSLSVEDFVFLEGVYSHEFLTRWLSSVGNYRTVGPSFGIVAENRPSDASIAQTTLPLVVTANVIQPLTVDVNVGLIFSENGNFAQLTTKQEQLALSGVDEGDVNVIFLEYLTILTENRISNFSQTNVPAQRARGTENDSILQVASLTDWINPVKFTAERKKDIVVLAISIIVDTSGTLTQSIDMSQNSFSFVRPWYSLVDVQHRQEIGTGTVSNTNPHGTGINDLSAGNITLYRQFLETGAVLSKALDAPHVPGLLCTETIPAAVVLTDTTGLITAGSRYGGIDSQYVYLQFFPTTMSSCWENGIPQNTLSVDNVPGTTIMVFSPREVIPSGGVIVNYFHVFALESPSIITSNIITFGQPQEERELIISNGVAFDNIDTPQINLEASGPIPVDYTVVVDGLENFIALPQRLLGPVKLSAIGTSATTISTPMYGEALIKIGLTRATPSPSLDIEIEVTGTDSEGEAIFSKISFGEDWTDTTIPGEETDTQFIKTVEIFKTISSIKVLNRVDDGANSTIIVWADIKPFITTNLAESCPVVDATWDGAAVSKLVDKRLFIPSLSYSNRKNQMLAMSSATLVGAIAALNTVNAEGESITSQLNSLVFVEDFNDPQFLDTLQIDAEPTSATGTIKIINNNNVTDGDLLTIAEIDGVEIQLMAKNRNYGLSIGGEDVSTALPLIDLSPQSDTNFNILIDNDVAGSQEVTLQDLAGLTTGKLIAAAMETRIRLIGTPPSGTVDYTAVQVDFNGQTYAFGSANVYTIRSGTSGDGSSVVIFNSDTFNLADDLLLGLANTGTEILGVDNDFANGEFDIGDTGDDTRNSIIVTISDTSFEPGMTATASTDINTTDLLQTATGAITNYPLTVANEAVTGTWEVVGFADGFDTHRSVNYTTYNSGIDYLPLLESDDSSTKRNKYRTRAVTVRANQETVTLMVLVHNATNLDTGSVKVRPTFTGTPTIWQPFVTAQQIANTQDTAFLATFAQPVSKFEIEVTGKMEGISVYSLIANNIILA